MNTLLQPEIKSPCDTPCDSPCGDDSPCDEAPMAPKSAWHRLLENSLHNTLDIAFDEVRKEPKKILMVGGCRQRDFARHIALLLPAADISLVDPDAEQARLAKEEVCCRFKFITTPTEAMPFDNGQFDLVIAHNLPEFCDDWQAALAEIRRVTSNDQGNVMISLPRKAFWNSLSWLPGLKAALAKTGTTLTGPSLKPENVICFLGKTAPIHLKTNPFPWTWLVANT